MREAFGHKIVNTRWSLRRPYAENVKRPFGFAHLMLKKQMDGKVILSETQSEFKQKYETDEKRPPFPDALVLGKLA